MLFICEAYTYGDNKYQFEYVKTKANTVLNTLFNLMFNNHIIVNN